ncbi:MAG: aromatic ring-hydroxylating dioxygenase subunit alpha [Planctomycetota bacterium]
MMETQQRVNTLIADHKRGHALAQPFYTDPDIYQLEIDRILTRNWIMVGHVSQVPNTGDFLVHEMAGESAIVTRDKDGQVQAFANVCRHRGSAICLQSRGTVRKLVCPYHGWAYDLDGRLLAARAMLDTFEPVDHSLISIPIKILGGLIFLCFCDDPPSLDDAERDLSEPLSWFGMDELKVAAEETYSIAANWKLAIENYQECYHCATSHPEYSQIHTRKVDPLRRVRLQHKMRERIPECGGGMRDIAIDFIDTFANPGQQGYGYERVALFDGFQTGSRSGEPLAPLLGTMTDFDGGASDFVIGPFTFLLAYSDHVVAYVFAPVDHGHCTCKIYWMVRADAIEGTDYNRDELIWLWDVTTQADKRIIVNNWKGVCSKYYRPGPFSKMEEMEQRFTEWVLQEIGSEHAVECRN